MDIDKHLNNMGYKAQDKITGWKGVVTSVSFDLYGCIQYLVTPEADKSEIKAGFWLDAPRVKLTGQKRVMGLPDFETDYYLSEGKKGPADKPAK